MFFPRLRRHAKWMFLFLALAFGLGFVGFGVGAGGVGVGDVFRDAAGGSGVPSISDSEQKVLDNPKDAQAFKDLATAYQAEGDIDQAVEAMASYTALKPKDTDALRELAALYLQNDPGASPAGVATALTATATSGVVKSAGRNSPNRLLFTNY